MKSQTLKYENQPILFELEFEPNLDHARFNGRSGAFIDNMRLPIHRWYRYSAGFSADWVRWFLHKYAEQFPNFSVLDPFCGVGTTMLACNAENCKSLGFETHPFVKRIANAKLHSIDTDLYQLRIVFKNFLEELESFQAKKPDEASPLLLRCYTTETLSLLIRMRELFLLEFDNKTSETELLWLALSSILRCCSAAGTAQWQYILPNKTKLNVQHPSIALQLKMAEIVKDIEYAQYHNWSNAAQVLQTDARAPQGFPALQVDAVITSPPYPNNYDYADATRLEMTFWGDVNGWGDLQNAVRKYLIRSCSQHAAAEKLELEDLLSESVLAPIRVELSEACRTLASVRETKGGRKSYHLMAAAYFRDLGLVFQSLRSICRKGSIICFVIGDSAPYGVYLNVDDWLGKLAVAAGFKMYSFEKIRDRNVKWKNRKHNVPLKEGRLWIEG